MNDVFKALSDPTRRRIIELPWIYALRGPGEDVAEKE